MNHALRIDQPRIESQLPALICALSPRIDDDFAVVAGVIGPNSAHEALGRKWVERLQYEQRVADVAPECFDFAAPLEPAAERRLMSTLRESGLLAIAAAVSLNAARGAFEDIRSERQLQDFALRIAAQESFMLIARAIEAFTSGALACILAEDDERFHVAASGAWNELRQSGFSGRDYFAEIAFAPYVRYSALWPARMIALESLRAAPAHGERPIATALYQLIGIRASASMLSTNTLNDLAMQGLAAV